MTQPDDALKQWEALSGARSSSLASKVAIVVGAGIGANVDLRTPPVGAATCLALARKGCRIAAMGHGPDGVKRTADLIGELGGEAIALHGDASEAAACESAVAATLDAFGRVDIVVNNLGVRFSGKGALDVSVDEWDRVMAINAKSVMLMAKYAAPHMSAGGAIVNVSSIGANRPTYTTSIVYSASQGAVDSLTITLAVQLAVLGIRVNGIAPGNLWTPLAAQEVVNRAVDEVPVAREKRRLSNPLQLEGTGWDVAHAAAFLAGDEARWITGQNLVIDGGAMLPAPTAKRP